MPDDDVEKQFADAVNMGATELKKWLETDESKSVGAGGKDYELGTFASEEEAALGRNFGEKLVPGARRVANIIPPEKMPDEAAQKRVAATVVALLRAKGVLPPGEECPTRAGRVEGGLPEKDLTRE